MRRYQLGLAHYDAGDPERALRELSAAHELSGNFQLSFNIAQLHYQLAHFARARETLQRYLLEGGSRIDGERRRLVARQLEALEQRTAVLIVDLGGVPAVLEVQGRRIPSSGTELALVVDPGELRVLAWRAGLQRVERNVWTKPGQVLRLTLAFGASTPAPSPPLWQRAEVWSFGAAGLLGVGAIVAGVATSSAAGRYERLRTQIGGGSAAETRQRLDRQRGLVSRWAAATDVLALGSLTAASLGLYLSLDSGPDEPAAQLALGSSSIQLAGSF
ncbi:MAG: hypothetical protein RL685_5927 [Pseudomonadota bacterium]